LKGLRDALWKGLPRAGVLMRVKIGRCHGASEGADPSLFCGNTFGKALSDLALRNPRLRTRSLKSERDSPVIKFCLTMRHFFSKDIKGLVTQLGEKGARGRREERNVKC
jgi:hypothetical protein